MEVAVFMKKTKKFFILILALLLAALHTSADAAAMLPEIQGWTNGELMRTELNAISGSKGCWFERDYRTPSGMPCHAVLMSGISGAAVNCKIDEMNNSEGEKAEAVSIEDIKAVIEYHPVLGFSLSAKINRNAQLTLEAKNADKQELINAAGEIIRQINNAAKNE